jgi:hypothetical protein
MAQLDVMRNADKFRKPMGKVSQKWVDRVEAYHNKKLVRIGKFDLELLYEMLDLLCTEPSGEIELFASSNDKLPSGGVAGLFVAKYDGKEYVALGGLKE